MQVQTILQSIPVLQEIMGMKLPFALGYELQKKTDELDVVTRTYDTARTKLLTKYGSLSEDGQTYSFKDEDRIKYDTKHEALVTEEVKLKLTCISAKKFSIF